MQQEDKKEAKIVAKQAKKDIKDENDLDKAISKIVTAYRKITAKLYSDLRRRCATFDKVQKFNFDGVISKIGALTNKELKSKIATKLEKVISSMMSETCSNFSDIIEETDSTYESDMEEYIERLFEYSNISEEDEDDDSKPVPTETSEAKAVSTTIPSSSASDAGAAVALNVEQENEKPAKKQKLKTAEDIHVTKTYFV